MANYNTQQVVINTKQLERLSDEFSGFPRDMMVAVKSSLARTQRTAVTQLGRVIPKHFTISRKNIIHGSKTRTAIKASNNMADMGISITGRTLTLARFRHTPVTPPAKRYRVKAKVKKASRLSAMAGVRGDDGRVKYPFLMSTGAKSADKIQHNIFIRTGRRNSKGQEAVKPLYSVSVPQMALSTEAGDEIIAAINQTFEKRLEHEIHRKLDIVAQEVAKA